MSPADKKVMLEIADAWLGCAKQTEGKSTGKNVQQEKASSGTSRK
jgi:hypothetical protein